MAEDSEPSARDDDEEHDVSDEGYASLDSEARAARRVSGVHDRSPSVIASGGRGKKMRRTGTRLYLRFVQPTSRRYAHVALYPRAPRDSADVSTVGRITPSTATGSSSAASDAHVREPAECAAVPSAAHEIIQRRQYVLKVEPVGSLQSFEWRQRFIAKWFEHAKLAYEQKTLRRNTRDTARAAFGERLTASAQVSAAVSLHQQRLESKDARITELQGELDKARRELALAQKKIDGARLGERAKSEEPSCDAMRKKIVLRRADRPTRRMSGVRG